MCGRFTLFSDIALLEQSFGFAGGYHLQPRYNIAPTQSVLAVRVREDGNREGVPLRWGLIPSWAKDSKIGASMINARSETVAEKPSFRNALKKRRCLIPADGYYEWKVLAKGKQPYYIHLKKRKPMAFAGLWERWKDPDGALAESCTIHTTTPVKLMAQIRDRMPVILPRDSFALWLDPTMQDAAVLQPLFLPYPEREMMIHAVSSQVGSVKTQGVSLIEPLEVTGGYPGV